MLQIRCSISPGKSPSLDKSAIEDWIEAVMRRAKNIAQQEMGRQGAGGPHSAPGEYPVIQSGELVGSLEVKVEGLTGEISASNPAAEWLEHGTPGGQMAPRPYLRPSVLRACNQIPFPKTIVTWK